jgi:hypothetical protein
LSLTLLGPVPTDFDFGSFPTYDEHYLDLLEAVIARVPWVADLGLQVQFNGTCCMDSSPA